MISNYNMSKYIKIRHHGRIINTLIYFLRAFFLVKSGLSALGYSANFDPPPLLELQNRGAML